MLIQDVWHSGKVVNFLCFLGLEAAHDFCFLEMPIIFYSTEKVLFQVAVYFEPGDLQDMKKDLYLLFLKDNSIPNVIRVDLHCDLIW